MNGAVTAFLLGFSALLSIVNPASGALIFRQVTADRTRADRQRLARRVATNSFFVMVGALWAGSYVLAFFGVSIAALRIAGGLVVALNAWGLLNAPEKRELRKQEQAAGAGGAEDVAFYPLTIPFTTGPGTISVAVTLGSGRPPIGVDRLQFFAGLGLAAAVVAAVVWIAFGFADRALDRLGPGGSRVLTRLFAFLLMCIGVQILIHGVSEVLASVMRAPPS